MIKNRNKINNLIKNKKNFNKKIKLIKIKFNIHQNKQNN